MVKLLLNKGANLSVIDKKERQPIHCAAYLGEQLAKHVMILVIPLKVFLKSVFNKAQFLNGWKLGVCI